MRQDNVRPMKPLDKTIKKKVFLEGRQERRENGDRWSRNDTLTFVPLDQIFYIDMTCADLESKYSDVHGSIT